MLFKNTKKPTPNKTKVYKCKSFTNYLHDNRYSLGQ